MGPASAREIEAATDQCWPSPHERRDGWLLRLGHSTQLRPSSATYLGESTPVGALDRTIGKLEQAYKRRQSALAVQIIEAPDFLAHDAIATFLSQRGYHQQEPSLVYTADLASLVPDEGQRAGGLHDCVVTDIHVEHDLTSLVDGGWPDRRQITSVAELLEVASVLATCSIDNQRVGLARGAVTGPWLGCFNFFVIPTARGRGIGSHLMWRVAEWGTRQGATGAFLQVETRNTSAQRLYQHLGFRACYRYHYLVNPR